MPEKNETSRYRLIVENTPGQLLKLTKDLSDSGVDVSALTVANLGRTAAIQFAAPRDCVLPSGYRKARID